MKLTHFSSCCVSFANNGRPTKAKLQPDTAAVKTNAAPVFNPPLDIPPKNTPPDSTKKGRGVKGITDADYKIVPKKDSSKS